jgi:hypothetical protein
MIPVSQRNVRAEQGDSASPWGEKLPRRLSSQAHPSNRRRVSPSFPGTHQLQEMDTTVSHPGRIWEYWLGGKDNYPADREAGDHIVGLMPDVVTQARAVGVGSVPGAAVPVLDQGLD